MAVEWSNPLLCQPVPCAPCPPACAPGYQPLPISTGNVGIDRCGNIEVYAAPRTVHRQVCWDRWPVPYQGVWFFRGGYSYPAPSSLAAIMKLGAPMAEWMIAQKRPPAS